jgi:hypothetical protein
MNLQEQIETLGALLGGRSAGAASANAAAESQSSEVSELAA